MKRADPIIQKSKEQQILRVEIMRLELKGYGYSIVSTTWLSSVLKVLAPKALDKMVVAE